MVYGYAKSILPLLGFLCWNIPPKKEYWAMYCTPFCGFIKMYNMVGMAMSWLQSCWERRIFCHKLATILPRYSILVPRHVAAKVVNKKYSKYWAYIMARKHFFCLTQELLKYSWAVKSERKLQSCLKLRKSQNIFCHILEISNKNYENKNCNDMFIQFRFIVSQSL